MKKIIILIPVYNDWDSLKKLLEEIDKNIKDIRNIIFKCIIVNDSSSIKLPKIQKPNNIFSIKIMNMKKNSGHARCNAFGIRHSVQHEDFNYLLLMDGDGEDRPEEIKSLVNKILEKPDNSVVAKRIKRSEGLFFRFLYNIHKIITYIFTGKKINFGNYSCLTKQDVKKLSIKSSLWSSFSGTVKKNLNDLNEIDSIRGLRYFGPSKMSLLKLLTHSFSIIAVFKYQVFLRSAFMLIALNLLKDYLGIFSLAAQILIIIFNITIYLVSFRENEKALLKSQDNLLNIKHITH